MHYSITRLVILLVFYITLCVFCGIAVLGCAEREDEIAVTLDEYISDVNLFIGHDQTREDLTVKITLEPEEKERRLCPVFDLHATVNEKKVSVSDSGYEVDETGAGRCRYPSFTYPVPEEEFVLTNFFLGESSPLWREVLGRLDVRVSDSSGDFRASFERIVPQDVKMSIIKPMSGELQAGEETEVEFDPVPEEMQEITIVYQPESDRSASVELNGEQKRSQDSTQSNVVFTMPSTNAGSGTLRIGIIPWNRFSVRCDFKQCAQETLELFYQNTPLFISEKVTVSP